MRRILQSPQPAKDADQAGSRGKMLQSMASAAVRPSFMDALADESTTNIGR